ncbi:hypothetical protein [Desulfosporosinus sp.]|uniref:hypothetical protein n=1 Tax=Desulfosporosinus sp. TaxID=157907 RepID=UPI000E98AC32|nr:hypothetical protein [Desulfosporosinus sp.]MBC2726396.1 hypothetical protein [Desulfosporosinus sp.]HBV86838.1 hypothetical protein [Desulfosporosinus sp.]
MRGLNLFNNPNTPNLMQSLGQSPIPLRGLERFMQRRGMNLSGYPQGGNYQSPNFQGPTFRAPNSQANISNTLDVQEPPEKISGIKAFLSRFSRKSNK